MGRFFFVPLFFTALIYGSCNSFSVQAPHAGPGQKDWKRELETQLPLYGHRNWVLVVDKAYPFQSSSGMTYVEADSGIASVMAHLLNAFSSSEHVRPVIYRDAELASLDESLVPGIADFRLDMQQVLGSFPVNEVLHEAVFRKMDEASDLFNVLVIKTNEVIPYSSVFIELDCAYWDGAREAQLRELMME